MTLSLDDALVAVSGRLGREVTRQELAYPFLEVDQEAIKDSVESRIRYEIWDQESPINGRSVEEIRQRRPDLGEAAYFIYVDDELKFFQPTHPTAGVPLNEDDVELVASEHVKTVRWEHARMQIVDALVGLTELREPAPPPVPTEPMR